MAKFCRYCGRPVRETAKFCPSCGKALAKKAVTQQPSAQAASSAPKSVRQASWQEQYERTQAQKRVQTGQRSLSGTRLASAPPDQQPLQAAYSQSQCTPSNWEAEQHAPMHEAIKPQVQTFAASTAAGELDLGEITIPGLTGISKTVTKVLAPVSGIIHGIGSYLSGIFQIFKRPAALIGVVLLAALWFVLAQFRDSESEIVRILSWLTFSNGGFNRTVPGMVGGALGKGTVAAAFISLFTGGLKNLFRGIVALFTGHGEKRGIPGVLFGILIGTAVSFTITGLNASFGAPMAGIAGSVLSLEALGGGSGKLYTLAQSLTSRKVNGIRSEARGRCDGLLTGLALGFALAAALTALGVLEGLL